MGKREWLKGYGGVFIPLITKLAVGQGVTRKLWVYAWKLRANLFFSPGIVTQTLWAVGSGVSGPIPGVSGLGRGKTLVWLF